MAYLSEVLRLLNQSVNSARGGVQIAYRLCSRCSQPAMMRVQIKDVEVHLCQRCFRGAEIKPERVSHICCVEGCEEPPCFFSKIDVVDDGVLFLCPEHFYEIEFKTELTVAECYIGKREETLVE